MTEGFYDLAFMSGIQSRGRGAVSGGNVNAYLYVCSKSVSRPRYSLARSIFDLRNYRYEQMMASRVFTSSQIIALFTCFFWKPLNKSKSSLYWFFIIILSRFEQLQIVENVY